MLVAQLQAVRACGEDAARVTLDEQSSCRPAMRSTSRYGQRLLQGPSQGVISAQSLQMLAERLHAPDPASSCRPAARSTSRRVQRSKFADACSAITCSQSLWQRRYKCLSGRPASSCHPSEVHFRCDQLPCAASKACSCLQRDCMQLWLAAELLHITCTHCADLVRLHVQFVRVGGGGADWENCHDRSLQVMPVLGHECPSAAVSSCWRRRWPSKDTCSNIICLTSYSRNETACCH